MRVRSPLLAQSFLFSFPAGTKMFQFPAFASCIHRMLPLQDNGLSHSEICGSMVICTCPQLIAAYHVLHRLREPRHPPCALIYFLFSNIQNTEPNTEKNPWKHGIMSAKRSTTESLNRLIYTFRSILNIDILNINTEYRY